MWHYYCSKSRWGRVTQNKVLNSHGLTITSLEYLAHNRQSFINSSEGSETISSYVLSHLDEVTEINLIPISKRVLIMISRS